MYKVSIKFLASTNVTVTDLARLFVLSKAYKNMCSSVDLSSDIIVSHVNLKCYCIIVFLPKRTF